MAEKSLLLQLLDQTWKDHLLSLDHLRQGINLRAYAQRDPLNEYKREAFELFEDMLVASARAGDLGAEPCRAARRAAARAAALRGIFVRRTGADSEREERWPTPRPERDAARRPSLRAAGSRARRAATAMPRRNGNGAPRRERASAPGERKSAPRAPWAGTPRNATCPCGSGKKFKHCHGRV